MVIPNASLDYGNLGHLLNDFSNLTPFGQDLVLFGRQIALSVRHQKVEPLNFPSLFWKMLALEPKPYPVSDLSSIDETVSPLFG